MNDDLAAVAASNGGVFSTADARDCGYDQRKVDREVARRRWHRLRRGWFVEASVWAAAEAEARHCLTARAVLLPLAGRQAASHTTAGVILGATRYRADLSLIHTTHLDGTRGRTENGVNHHQGPLDQAGCVTVGGLLVCPPPVAIAGEMLLTHQDGAVVVGDSAVNRGIVTVDELREVADDWLRYGGSRNLRYRVSLIDGAAESAGESLSRQLFRRGRLPLPVLQYRIDGPDGFVAYADFAWPEHGVLGEFDGKDKYLRGIREGETPGDAVFREKRREDRLRDLGWIVCRLVWADLFAPQRTVERFRAALERGLSITA